MAVAESGNQPSQRSIVVSNTSSNVSIIVTSNASNTSLVTNATSNINLMNDLPYPPNSPCRLKREHERILTRTNPVVINRQRMETDRTYQRHRKMRDKLLAPPVDELECQPDRGQQFLDQLCVVVDYWPDNLVRTMAVCDLYLKINPEELIEWPGSWKALEQRLRDVFKDRTIITLPDNHSVELMESEANNNGERTLIIDFWPHLTHPELPQCPSSLEATEALEREQAEERMKSLALELDWKRNSRC